MKRDEAVSLLKELSASEIIDPSWVSINDTAGHFSLKIKLENKSCNLEQFCCNNHLKLEERDGYLLISKA
jgi:hypothetical protein